MVPKDWVASIVKAGIEPMNITVESLIDRQVTLEATDITHINKESGASGGHISKKKEEKPEKGNWLQEP